MSLNTDLSQGQEMLLKERACFKTTQPAEPFHRTFDRTRELVLNVFEKNEHRTVARYW